MSYTPVYSSRINWENEPSIASPINATNLNKMDYALKAHDDTLANWDITKANESDLLLSLKSVDYDTDTGEFVFTWWNGTTKTVDLNIEKIPVSFSMDANGVITMTTDDGTTYTADVGALIKTYTFTDSSEIDFTVTTDASGNKTITASIVAGSIDGTKLTPNYLADCTAAKTGAETAEGKAEGSAEDAEAWAVGTRGGVPVPSTDPAYENNAEYWAHHTSSSLAGLTDTDIDNPSDGEVLKYNGTTSKWENGQASAGGGSTITVTTSESSLYGQSVTISDGVTTLTETFSNIGEATFTGVTLTGTLTLASGGASRSISIPYFGNYSFILSLFTATVTVTYPAGASCTLSDGVTTLTGTGSPMAFSVPNAGTWTATVTLDGASKTDSAVITTDGQTASITIEYGTINVTYDNAFRGTSITCVQGGTTITKTAPSGANTMTFYPPTTGNWVISGTVSGTSYSKTANVTSLSTSVSVSLETVPNGKTVLPTDDIETWLACGQITGKSYTTLSQVLDDAETYERLLSDSNACDYMKRSTTWASTICADADAMMRLGKYDYACYVLRDDNTWNTAINNSAYASYIPASPTGQTDIIVTAHGGDTVYYMENGSPVTLTTADRDTGIGTVDWSDLPKGAITLYSSTAKNPSDLTADYSKTVYITEYTTQIYLMPDNALYWKGYERSDLEDCTTANGWSLTGRTFVSPTHNTNSIYTNATSSSTFSGVGSKYPMSIAKVHCIARGVNQTDGKYSQLSAMSAKDYINNIVQTQHLTSASLTKIDIDASASYVGFGGINGRNAYLDALWYE